MAQLSLPLPETSKTKPYDWTYSTTYSGHSSSLEQDDVLFQPADPVDPAQSIPLARLARKDPILFFAEIPLFEDELHDNGASQLTVRVRVMPTCFFVLSRYTLRVDNVLFRTLDTRIFHDFSVRSPFIVREAKGWEAPHKAIKQFLPNQDDLTPLTDPNFIVNSLGSLPHTLTQQDGALTGWRGMGTKLEVVRVEQL